MLSVFTKFKEHIGKLESGILKCKNATIDDYLNLYINYPLAEEMKSNILEMLKNKHKKVLKKWIFNPAFYYLPILHEWHKEHLTPLDYCYDIKDREKIKYFFKISGCEDILLRIPFRIDMTFALNWAKIVQEPRLKEYISNVVEYYKRAIKKKLIENETLQDYENFLNNSTN